MRLQKWLSQAELRSSDGKIVRLSRRKAEDEIVRGQVSVNGQVVTQLGVQIDPDLDVVLYQGHPVRAQEERVTLSLYKPKGVVTTRQDPEGRKTVMDLLPPEYQGLFPIGRLDVSSEGLLLLTNDGELAHRLMHPSFQVQKIYQVKVVGQKNHEVCGPRHFEKFLSGVELEDGLGRFVEVKPLAEGWIEVRVEEGRNRFIRRMFEALGFQVGRLKRVQVGKLQLGFLQPGQWRLEEDLKI